jgi:hypothetical protein
MTNLTIRLISILAIKARSEHSVPETGKGRTEGRGTETDNGIEAGLTTMMTDKGITDAGAGTDNENSTSK